MTQLHGQGAGYKLIVQCFKHPLFVNLELCQRDPVVRIDVLFLHHTQAIQRRQTAQMHAGNVDFVERQPVLHLVFVPGHDRPGILQEQVHHVPVGEPAVFCDNRPGDLIVTQSHDRFDAIFHTFIKNSIVECQTGFIGVFIVAAGENPSPVYGQPEAGETHTGQKCNVFLVPMVEIHGLMTGIEGGRIFPGQEGAGCVHITSQQHIGDREQLAILQIGAFTLVGGHCTAPQKLFGKPHDRSSLSVLRIPLLKRFQRDSMGFGFATSSRQADKNCRNAVEDTPPDSLLPAGIPCLNRIVR